MASMASLIKPSSFLVNGGPSLRNPLLRTTTQISLLPSSMMIKKSSATASGFIRTIKCSSSSNSNRGSDYYFRVRCAVKEEEEKDLFKEVKAMLKALTTPVVAAILVNILLTRYPTLVSSRTPIFFGAMLAYDLCRAIASTRRIDDGRIRLSLGPVLGSIVLFLWALMAVFGKGTIGTVTWEGGNEKNTSIAHNIIGYMVKIVGYIVLFMGLIKVTLFGFGTMTLPWPRSKKKKKSTKLQKLTDDMDKLSSKIKVHEENLRIMKSQSDKLDEPILYMQGILQLNGLFDKIPLSLASTEDVLDVVAFLGTVDDDNLSRIFSEYLGLETMMAIVCKTAKSLETCYKEGPAIGRPVVDGRFLVICLEDLRPFAGDFVADDPQRRLALLKPRLPSGECPPGFLGFAVNMIILDKLNLHYVTSNGNGLRETLFYSLFSHLQVYRTRAEMQLALPCISDGAVSLDGGMIRSAGVFSLGNRKDVEVRFMVTSGTSNPPVYCKNAKEKIKIMKSDKKRLLEDMQREQTLLNHVKHSAVSKRQELLKFLAELSHESATSSGRS